MKKYKLSQYNLHCLDKDGNLLMCNFLSGIQSFSIVENEKVNIFKRNILEQKEILPNTENEVLISILSNKGFIVEENVDEYSLYNAKFYESVYAGSWQLIILPTHKCNFRCKYCYENTEFRSKKEMNREEADRILKYIQKNAVFYPKLKVAWFGGEPLLALDMVKYLSEGILKICVSQKIKYDAEITTNGFNLTPDVFDMLYHYKIYIYQITLDGTQNEHDMQRVHVNGSGTFEKIFANLKYIRNNKQKYKFARITIRTNVTKNIITNLEEFLDLYEKNFSADDRFVLRLTEAAQYDQYMGDNLSEERLAKEEYIKRNDFLNKIYQSEHRNVILSNENIIDMFIPTKHLCYAAARNKYVIDTDLKIYKCTVHFNLEDNNIGYINCNGDMILQDNLNQKWYVRNQFPDLCRKCFYLPCCNKTGCPVKYNSLSEVKFTNCHMEDLREKMKINLRMLVDKVRFFEIKIGESNEYNKNKFLY